MALGLSDACRRYVEGKSHLVAEGGAVASIASAQLVSPMPQQHHPRTAPENPSTAMQLALGLCSQPQRSPYVEVHDSVRRAQQICVASHGLIQGHTHRADSAASATHTAIRMRFLCAPALNVHLSAGPNSEPQRQQMCGSACDLLFGLQLKSTARADVLEAQMAAALTQQVRLVPVKCSQRARHLDEAPLPVRGIRPELCQRIDGRLPAQQDSLLHTNIFAVLCGEASRSTGAVCRCKSPTFADEKWQTSSCSAACGTSQKTCSPWHAKKIRYLSGDCPLSKQMDARSMGAPGGSALCASAASSMESTPPLNRTRTGALPAPEPALGLGPQLLVLGAGNSMLWQRVSTACCRASSACNKLASLLNVPTWGDQCTLADHESAMEHVAFLAHVQQTSCGGGTTMQTAMAGLQQSRDSSYLLARALKPVHFALLIIIAAGPTQMLWMLILHQALHHWRACCVALHCILYPALKEAGISKANAVDAWLQLLRKQEYTSQG